MYIYIRYEMSRVYRHGSSSGFIGGFLADSSHIYLIELESEAKPSACHERTYIYRYIYQIGQITQAIKVRHPYM